MAATSVQFAVATHLMTALGYYYDEPITSRVLAESVNVRPEFIRASFAKLARAGLVTATRGKNGHYSLSRPPEKITMKEIYLAAEPPPAVNPHGYPANETCPISSNIESVMDLIQMKTQVSVEQTLSKITLASMVADLRKRKQSLASSR